MLKHICATECKCMRRASLRLVLLQVISALICKCLGLSHERLNQFRFSAGSITVIEFPSPDDLSRIVVRPACVARNGALEDDALQQGRVSAAYSGAACLTARRHYAGDPAAGKLALHSGCCSPTHDFLPLVAETIKRLQVRCTNYTAHLGRWSVPLTPEEGDLEGVCGLDGCF